MNPPTRSPSRIVISCAALMLGQLLFCATVRAEPLGEMLQAIARYDYGESKAGLYRVDQALRTVDAGVAESALVRFLESDPRPSLAARQYACEKLGLVGAGDAPRTLALLQGMLNDPQTFDMALWVMERIGGAATDRILVQTLNETESATSQAALINTLGRHRFPDAVDALAPRVAGPDARVTASALTALGRIGTPAAAEALDGALAQVNRQQHAVALEAVLVCAEHLAAAAGRDQALAMYQRLSDPAYPPIVRAAALSGIMQCAPDQAGAMVIKALESDDVELRHAAVVLARTGGDHRTTRALTRSLPNLDGAGQVQLLAALGMRGDKTAAPAVEPLVGHADLPVRVAALETLGHLGGPDTIFLLADTAAQTSGPEREAARRSLYALVGSEIDPAILSQIPSAPDVVKPELIRSVEARGIKGAVPLLSQTVTHPDPQVRRESIRALMAVAEPGHVAALIDLMVSLPDASQRAGLEQVLARVAGRNPDVSTRARELLAAWERVADPASRSSLLRVAGKTGDPHALPMLREASAGAEDSVRDAAVRALADWPDATGIEAVWAVAQDANDATHQILCQRAYLRMVGQLSGQSDQAMRQYYEKASTLLTDTGGKQLLLGALADHERLPALETAAGMLSDPAVKAEAQVAVVRISQALSGTYPRQVEPALESVLQDPVNETVGNQAGDLLKRLEQLGSYVTCWQVAGPYLDQEDLFEFAFAPEQPGSEVPWNVMPLGTDGARPWILNFGDLLGGQTRVAYLRNRVHSDREQAVRLEIGSDDGVKVWLNGELVHANDVVRPLQPNQDKVDVTLRAGWNTLRVKITQGGGGWEASVRIVDGDGRRVPDLEYALIED